MNRDQKAAVVDELAEEIRGAEAIFAVDYRGITVSQAAELRSRLREADTRFRVVKNSLTERASDKAGAESLKELLEGPTALAFVAGDAALAAKALNDQARTLGTLEFKGGLMDGAPLTRRRDPHDRAAPRAGRAPRPARRRDRLAVERARADPERADLGAGLAAGQIAEKGLVRARRRRSSEGAGA